MEFFNLNDFKLDIKYPDIYFTPDYGSVCQLSDNNSKWEICVYKDLIYVYLKRQYNYKNKTYYDLITPYGYSGFHYKNINTFTEFIPKFRQIAKQKNYLTEVVRQNPYININITNYDVITEKKLYGVNLNKDYLEKTNKSNRKMIRKGINNLTFEINQNLNDFIKIYNITMDNLNSSKYYYFNDNYFNSLQNYFIANVYYNNILCSSAIIFKYNNYLHYHLGGSLQEYRKYGCNNFLHYKVMEYGLNNNFDKYILGCGLKDNDSLSQFKKSMANVEHNYIIYKNIINSEVYEEINKNNKNDFFPKHQF